MAVEVRIDASQIDAAHRALAGLHRSIQGKVMARVLNRVGDMVFTRVVRILASETGASQQRVRRALTKKRAYAESPDYIIRASDEYMSLKDFKPREVRRGVSAAPWGQRRVFPGTFIGPGGHVFKRVGKERGAIKKLWGPAVPLELVRGATPELVDQVLDEQFHARLVHEVGREIAAVKRKEKV